MVRERSGQLAYGGPTSQGCQLSELGLDGGASGVQFYALLEA